MTGRPGFEALAPFFRIIAEGLNGLVDGEDFFDTLAEVAVFEYAISVPGYPRRVAGPRSRRGALPQLGGTIVLHGSDELAVHHWACLRQPLVSVITIKDRKITHWRDYLEPVAVFDGIGWPAHRT